MKRYVIVGNGAAAVGCIEGIRALDAEGEITVVSKMNYRPADFYEKNGCRVLYGRRAVALDPNKKTVTLDGGDALPYDALLIATGSRPFVPPFEGLDTVEKKYSFMTLDDALALEGALDGKARVLIVGAGLIGLKCAEGIKDRVGQITVCDLADRVLSSILDADCADVVQKHLEESGIDFLLGDTAVKFDRNVATMKSGVTVDFDVLVLAVGVRANTDLVKDAGGSVNRGIVVDQRCATDLPSVFAAGDCAEGYDSSTGGNRVRQPRARDPAERLPAGAYRREQYGGGRRSAVERDPDELDRLLRSAYHDRRRLRRRDDRREERRGDQTLLYKGRSAPRVYPDRTDRTRRDLYLSGARKDASFDARFRPDEKNCFQFDLFARKP